MRAKEGFVAIIDDNGEWIGIGIPIPMSLSDFKDKYPSKIKETMTMEQFELAAEMSVDEIDPDQLALLISAARREVYGVSRAEAYRWIAQNATQQNWWSLCNEKAEEIEERLQP